VARKKIVACHACGTPIEVPLRGKVGVRYCSDTCRPTCRVDGCGQMATASLGYCWGHYQRLRKYGKADAPRRPTGPAPRPPQPCAVDECEKPSTSYGLCNGHAAAWRRANNPIKCSVEGCATPVHAKGLCMKHYIRTAKFGDAEGTAWPSTCPAGHAFTPENTRLARDKRDGSLSRVCLACHRSRQAKRRATTRGADSELILTPELMERDDWTCGLCGSPIPPLASWPDPLFGTVDHVVPLSRGGTHTWSNVQAAHLRCNMSKNDQMPDEYSEDDFVRLWVD
jgi:5-methylcytosine-specific restriction endonuclease McrA